MSKTILNEFILRGRTSLRVNLSHMNEFQIVYDFHSVTFSLHVYTLKYAKVCKCLFLASPVLIDISFGHISCKMVSVLATYHHIATHAGLRLSVRENFDVAVKLMTST